MAEHYAAAGVSLEAGYKSVELIKEHVKKTMRPEVLGGLGGFSGAFSLSKIKDMEEQCCFLVRMVVEQKLNLRWL